MPDEVVAVEALAVFVAYVVVVVPPTREAPQDEQNLSLAETVCPQLGQ
jgi:hypothetical protein